MKLGATGSATSRRQRGRVSLLLCCFTIASALAQVGCGSSQNGLPPQVVNTPAQLGLLTAADVQALPADSPQRAVFAWWRLMQFRDPPDALMLFTPSVRAELLRSDYRDAVILDFGPYLTHLRPTVTSVETNGNHAVVYLTILSTQQIGPVVTRRVEDYLALPLDRVGNYWLLSDSSFFTSETSVAHAARVQAQHPRP